MNYFPAKDSQRGEGRLRPLLTFGFVLHLFVSAVTLSAQEKYAPMNRLTWEEYAATLSFWKKTFPKWVSLETRGLSGQNMPVYLVKITDSAVPDEDKQVCLVTTLHCGPERSGTAGALALIDWLVSDDPLAQETRQKQIILVMPVVNPLAMFYTDRFRNEHGVDPYSGLGPVGKVWDVKALSLITPEKAPELVAVLSVVDQYRPEVHADLHGTGLQEYAPDQIGSRRMYQGQIMTEITGGAYSNYALRPWDWRVTEVMIEAGKKAGFPSDRFEADAQRTFWGAELAPLGRKLWHGMPMFYSAHYGYAKYHTMILTQEVAWEASLVARMKGLFKIGNEVWLDERLPGYPVDRMRHFVGHYVTTYGTTASARRESREELWNQQSNFVPGFLYPQTDGRESFVVATTAAAKKIVAVDDLPTLVGNLKEAFGASAASIEQFIGEGPEIKLAMEAAKPQLLAATPDTDAEITHGIGFRIRLPGRVSKEIVVHLNGNRLSRDPVNGFESWFADGFTQVQVNVAPESIATLGLYFVTCAYTAEAERTTGWMPPQEVQKRFSTAQADATPATYSDVAYGAHFRQTLDFWQASPDEATPLVFYLHGGGWAAQDKSDIHQHLDVRGLLDAGISVVSVNYRFLVDANAASVTPPLQWPLQDAARALQFVRSKAKEWHLDPTRIAASGVSAGGCSSLWLAMHDEMAKPQSSDPVERESTRLLFTATKAPQPSLDPAVLVEWIPNSEYGGQAFGFPGATRADSFAPFLANRETIQEDLHRYSPLAHASKDDPPAFLFFTKADKPPVKGEPQTDPTHSAVLGLLLRETLDSLGVRCEVHYPGDAQSSVGNLQETLLRELKTKPQ